MEREDKEESLSKRVQSQVFIRGTFRIFHYKVIIKKILKHNIKASCSVFHMYKNIITSIFLFKTTFRILRMMLFGATGLAQLVKLSVWRFKFCFFWRSWWRRVNFGCKCFSWQFKSVTFFWLLPTFNKNVPSCPCWSPSNPYPIPNAI